MATFAYAERTPRHSHLRAYLAGVGATAALTAGVLAAFLSLAAFMAFEGLPFGRSSEGPGLTYLGTNASTAPSMAAAALKAAPGAVAKNAVPGDGGASGSSVATRSG